VGRRFPPKLTIRRLLAGAALGALAAGVVAAQPVAPDAPAPKAAPAAKAAVPEEVAPAEATLPLKVLKVAPEPQTPAVAPAPPEDIAPAAPPKAEAAAKPAEPARRTRYDIAVLQALDKVTAETLRFEAPVGKPVRWKGLIFTVSACERSAPDEPVEDSIVYVTIDAQPRPQPGRATPPPRQAFKGWLFASSPSLNPVENTAYDAWAISCRASAPASAPPAAPVRPPPAKVPLPPDETTPRTLDLPPPEVGPVTASAPKPALSPAPPAAPPAAPPPAKAAPEPKAAPISPPFSA
jgi:hypothetical protein